MEQIVQSSETATRKTMPRAYEEEMVVEQHVILLLWVMVHGSYAVQYVVIK